jgi:hypothetical protein
VKFLVQFKQDNGHWVDSVREDLDGDYNCTIPAVFYTREEADAFIAAIGNRDRFRVVVTAVKL